MNYLLLSCYSDHVNPAFILGIAGSEYWKHFHNTCIYLYDDNAEILSGFSF